MKRLLSVVIISGLSCSLAVGSLFSMNSNTFGGDLRTKMMSLGQQQKFTLKDLEERLKRTRNEAEKIELRRQINGLNKEINRPKPYDFGIPGLRKTRS